jgi:hypothetical protein
LPGNPIAPKKNKGQKVDLATFMSEAAREHPKFPCFSQVVLRGPDPVWRKRKRKVVLKAGRGLYWSISDGVVSLMLFLSCGFVLATGSWADEMDDLPIARECFFYYFGSFWPRLHESRVTHGERTQLLILMRTRKT